MSADVHGSIRYRFRGRVPRRDAANRWTPGARLERRAPLARLGSVRGAADARSIRPAACSPRRTTGPRAPTRRTSAWTSAGRAGCGASSRGSSRCSAATADDMRAIHADDLSLVAPLFVRALDGVEAAGERAREALATLRRWDGRMADRLGRRGALRGVPRAADLPGRRRARPGEPDPRRARRARDRARAPRARRERPARPARGALRSAGRARSTGRRSARARSSARSPSSRRGSARRSASWRYGAAAPLVRVAPARGRPARGAPAAPAAVGADGRRRRHRAVWNAPPPASTCARPRCRWRATCSTWATGSAAAGRSPHGVAADPASVHHADQLLAWTEQRLVPMRFDWRGIEATARARRSARRPRRGLMRLSRAFFARPCLEVAPELLGLVLVHELADGDPAGGAHRRGRGLPRRRQRRGLARAPRADPALPGHVRPARTLLRVPQHGPARVRERGLRAGGQRRGGAAARGASRSRARRGCAGCAEAATAASSRTDRASSRRRSASASRTTAPTPCAGRSGSSGPPRTRAVEIRVSPRIGITKSADLPYRFFARATARTFRARPGTRALVSSRRRDRRRPVPRSSSRARASCAPRAASPSIARRSG